MFAKRHCYTQTTLITHYPYYFTADHRRILTVVTTSPKTLSKWLTDLLKSTAKGTPNHNPILVGFSAEYDVVRYTKRGVKDLPYDIVTLCVGSQCIVYHFDTRHSEYGPRNLTNKTLRDFLENPKIAAVGMNMDVACERMERHHGIKIKNAIDLRALVYETLMKKKKDKCMDEEEEEEVVLDVGRYNLDKVAVKVLGKEFEVARPQKKKKKVEWYASDGGKRCYFWYWRRQLRLEKVQFVTVDAHLCFLVGSKCYDMIHGSVTEEVIGNSIKKNVKREKMKI
ncbi:hypothetical protein RIF29_24812 [Crotalaria pallida]|uniref:3'-5' exonuclease domain-containing protein n=1 Tax=Crotalaria pallida TaxID=3830 RepID=A0AAN9EL07_CROPI